MKDGDKNKKLSPSFYFHKLDLMFLFINDVINICHAEKTQSWL